MSYSCLQQRLCSTSILSQQYPLRLVQRKIRTQPLKAREKWRYEWPGQDLLGPTRHILSHTYIFAEAALTLVRKVPSVSERMIVHRCLGTWRGSIYCCCCTSSVDEYRLCLGILNTNSSQHTLSCARRMRYISNDSMPHKTRYPEKSREDFFMGTN